MHNTVALWVYFFWGTVFCFHSQQGNTWTSSPPTAGKSKVPESSSHCILPIMPASPAQGAPSQEKNMILRTTLEQSSNQIPSYIITTIIEKAKYQKLWAYKYIMNCFIHSHIGQDFVFLSEHSLRAWCPPPLSVVAFLNHILSFLCVSHELILLNPPLYPYTTFPFLPSADTPRTVPKLGFTGLK